MDEILQQFIVEAKELIQQASDDLLVLERNPGDLHRLDSAFRAVHTLKGSVGLFDLEPLGRALHAAEDLLAAVRSDDSDLDAAAVNALLECLEVSERWVDSIEMSGHLPPDAYAIGRTLEESLRSLVDQSGEAAASVAPTADTAWADVLFRDARESGALAELAGHTLTAIRYEPRPDCFFSGDDPIGLMRSVPGLAMFRVSEREPWPPLAAFDPFTCNLVIEALSAASHADVAALFRFVPDQVRIVAREQGPAPARETLPDDAQAAATVAGMAPPRTMRVEAARIDRLADLVGELIVAKNALAHLADEAAKGGQDPALTEKLLDRHALIDRLAGSLHAAVVDVRMLPLRDVFRRFPRTVREIGARLGKAVNLTIAGEDIEADKAVIEALPEPLIHVFRNAIDHGAEPREARLAAGKPPEATIALRATRLGNRLSIAVTDDGRGIDPEQIRRIAGERGILPPEQLSGMTDAEVIGLIFSPGFSTSGSVTDLSGRGVGMDAVRAAVEGLGGQVSVSSRLGQGTTVRMTLPTSIVMTKVMTVEAGGRAFGILMDAVAETVSVRRDQVVPIRKGEAFVLRDRTIPLVRLASLLHLAAGNDHSDDIKVLIVQAGGERVGVAVERFIDRMDVMMRPMAGLLAEAPGLIGTTILGDGSVLMVLDMAELIG